MRLGRVRLNVNRVVSETAIIPLLLGLLFGPLPSTAAVHNVGLLELGDGTDPGIGTADIQGSAAQPGPDWGDLFDDTPTQPEIDAAVASFGGVAGVFIADDRSQSSSVDGTTFSGAGGSNKNNDPTSPPGDTWHWNAGNLPAKDDLSNVYGYATIPADGDLIVYLGFERIDASGDSHIDVELFQDEVGLVDMDGQPPCDSNLVDGHQGCHFSGTRTDNDIIVSMDFLRGGALGSVTIRRWLGSSYVDIPGGSLGAEGCNPAGLLPANTICAFNNAGSIYGGAWQNFNRHGATIENLERNAFTEFGMNVTALLNLTPCITTLMGKTRSSHSFTAELKDFAGPRSFQTCPPPTTSLRWLKFDHTDTLLGGATFEVCRTHDFVVETSGFVDIEDVCFDVVDDTDNVIGPGLDQDPDGGEFLLVDLPFGRYTVRESVPPQGWLVDSTVRTVELTPAAPNVTISIPWFNRTYNP